MSTKKINKKEMDEFFEMLKATVSCRHEQAQADAHLEPVQPGRATAGITAEGSAVRESLGKGAGIVLAPPAGIYQGNSEPSADDPFLDDEPYWSDSDTNREMWNSIEGR